MKKIRSKNKKFDILELPSLSKESCCSDVDCTTARDYPLPLETVERRLRTNIYDLNPPFQRSSIWSPTYQVKLIHSILSGIKINTIHVALSPWSETSYFVIDGRQRLEAVMAFIEGRIYLAIRKGDRFIKLDYSTLMTSMDTDVVLYRNRWESCQLGFTEHKICGKDATEILTKQIEIFNNVNYSKELSGAERLLCPNFMARGFIEYIEENCIGGLKDMLSSTCKKNERFDFWGTLLKIMVTAFGDTLSDKNGWQQRNVSMNSLRGVAENVHNNFWYNGITLDTTFDKSVLKKLGMDFIPVRMKMVFRWFNDILRYENDVSKEVTSGIFQDYSFFLLKKIEDNILTDTFIASDNNLKKMREWYVESYDARTQFMIEQGSNDSSCKKDALSNRQDVLQRVWFNYFKDTVKNKKVTSEQRRKALHNSSSRDPYSGARLTSHNAVVDHIFPKSGSSETTYQVISESSNLRKGSQDKQFSETYLKIIDEQELDKIEKDEKEAYKRGVEHSVDIFKG